MSSANNKFNVLQPTFGLNHHNHQPNLLIPGKPAAESSPVLQRSTVRKSFKRRLPQNLPVRDTSSAVPPPTTPVSRPVNLKNSLGPDPPASVARRNARERNRVKQVNTGFAVLRQHIPVLIGSAIVYGGSTTDSSSSSSSSNNSKKNKMSKVETLRCAVEYIRNLEKLLESGGSNGELQHQIIKEEPFELPLSPLTADSENISPSQMQQHDLSGFYDSSSSSESPDQLGGSFNSRLDESAECAAFKQELLRSLSCWSTAKEQEQTADIGLLMAEATGPTNINSSVAVQNMSDHSLLESLNSWWCPS